MQLESFRIVIVYLILDSVANSTYTKYKSTYFNNVSWNNPISRKAKVIFCKVLNAKPILLAEMLRFMNSVKFKRKQIVDVVLVFKKSNRKKSFSSFWGSSKDYLVIPWSFDKTWLYEVDVRNQNFGGIVVIKSVRIPFPGLRLYLYTGLKRSYKSNFVSNTASSSFTLFVI